LWGSASTGSTGTSGSRFALERFDSNAVDANSLNFLSSPTGTYYWSNTGSNSAIFVGPNLVFPASGVPMTLITTNPSPAYQLFTCPQRIYSLRVFANITVSPIPRPTAYTVLMSMVVGTNSPFVITSQSYPPPQSSTVQQFSLLLTFEYGPIPANTPFYFYLRTLTAIDPRPSISPFNNSYFTVEYEL